MRETGTQISHNPSSNAKLGNGVARLPEMLNAGLNVGLGHDAAECNNSRDLFEVMKFASLMHRATRVDASLQQAPDVVRMATRNGADALGHETGQLTAGHKADVILVDLKSQMFTPLMPDNADHLFSHLVFAANGSCVDTTIIDGKIVMEGRRLTTVDEQKVLREGQRRVPPGARPDGGPGSADRLIGASVTRYLVLGDPVVTLGAGDPDPGRGADRRGRADHRRRAARGAGGPGPVRPGARVGGPLRACRAS